MHNSNVEKFCLYGYLLALSLEIGPSNRHFGKHLKNLDCEWTPQLSWMQVEQQLQKHTSWGITCQLKMHSLASENLCDLNIYN